MYLFVISASDMRLLVPPSPRIAVLSIPSVSEDGDYICTASSAAGTIEEQFVIRVERGDGGFIGIFRFFFSFLYMDRLNFFFLIYHF